MPRKTKASAEEKAQIVEAYLRGEMGLKSAAAKLSVVISTMELWIALYRAEGSNAFVQAKRNRCYPPEVKEAATKEYLFGKDSILSICQKYCIRSTRSLQQWIKVYHAHGDFNSRKNSGGGSYMKQGRETTQEERVQIVKDCLASGKNYGEMALKYKVSYQQVAPGRCGSRRWARPVWRTGAESERKARCLELSWRKRRSRSNSSSTSCIWRKWSVTC